jgi:site-specific DNA recombinase
MEFIREDCIYARQSVDRKDSISIENPQSSIAIMT